MRDWILLLSARTIELIRCSYPEIEKAVKFLKNFTSNLIFRHLVRRFVEGEDVVLTS
jgi:hypothetical protein